MSFVLGWLGQGLETKELHGVLPAYRQECHDSERTQLLDFGLYEPCLRDDRLRVAVVGVDMHRHVGEIKVGARFELPIFLRERHPHQSGNQEGGIAVQQMRMVRGRRELFVIELLHRFG